MPELEAAFQKIVENAQANCEECQAEAFPPDCNCTTCRQTAGEFPPQLHTCDTAIKAAAEFGLVAVEAGWSSNCNLAADDAKAEVNRLKESALKGAAKK